MVKKRKRSKSKVTNHEGKPRHKEKMLEPPSNMDNDAQGHKKKWKIIWFFRLLIVLPYQRIILLPFQVVCGWIFGLRTSKEPPVKEENGYIGTNYKKCQELPKDDEELNKHVKEEKEYKQNSSTGAATGKKKDQSANKKKKRGKNKHQGKNIQHDENEIFQTIDAFESEQKQEKEDLEIRFQNTEDQNRQLTIENEEINKRLKQIEKELNRERKKNEGSKRDLESIKLERDNILKRLEMSEDSNSKLQRKLEDVNKSLKQIEIELEKERKQHNKRMQFSEQLVTTLKKEKNDALNRLSELMGEKLRDNNPAITNLNDPNRPMKLAEQFSELYENEWTDVFTDLDSESTPEIEIINTLLELLKEILRACGTEVNERIMELSQGENSNNVLKIKDFLKSQAAQNLQPLKMKIINDEKCPVVKTYSNRFGSYIEKCMNICYYAELQTPPMYISFDAGTTFDKQCFKEYTKSGTYVDYLVWPAMYLHKDGPLMAKGVLQPQENSTDC